MTEPTFRHGSIGSGQRGHALDAARSSSEISRWPFVAVALVATALLAGLLLAYAHLAGGLLVFPYQVMDAEGVHFIIGQELLAGVSPYRDPAVAPWVQAVYTPLFGLLGGLVSLATGPTLAAPRAVSLGATLTSLLAMGWLIGREGQALGLSRWDRPSRWRALAVVGLTLGAYLVSPFVREWSPLARSDMLALALALLAICAAQRATSGDHMDRWLVLAGTAGVAALGAKQTAVAAPLAIAAWLFLHGRQRKAAAFTSGVLLSTGALALALDRWSGGGFIQAAILGNSYPWWPRVFANLLRRLVLLYPWFLAGAALYAVSVIRRWRRPPLLGLYLVTSAAVTLSAGHTGAAMNYFLDLLAVATVCTAVVWQSWVDSYSRGPGPDQPARPDSARSSGLVRRAGGYQGTLMAIALCLQLAWFALADRSILAPLFERTREWGYAPTVQDRRVVGEIERLIAERGGPLLAEDPMLNVRAGLAPQAVPASALAALAAYGAWDTGPTGLEAAIARKQFRTVVLTKRGYPPSVLEAIEANYRLVRAEPRVVTGYRVYVPR